MFFFSFMSSEAGYAAKLVSAFVSAGPSSMYAYLAAHATTIIENLAKNMIHCGTLDIARFLLDVPLEGSYVHIYSYIDKKAWWGESATLIDPFIACLSDKTMCHYAYYFFVSIIQRATVYVYAIHYLLHLVFPSLNVLASS